MFRAKRKPAPFFKMPGTPFNPATGLRAPLGRPPVVGTTLAIFQVIGDDPTDPDTEDTHANYVVCRGYEAESDPLCRFLHDPYTFPDTTPINVAKPYSLRGTFPYEQGQIVVAAKIHNRLGDNPGVASVSTGHPADLDEEVELLLDDEGVAVSWMDITAPSPPGIHRGITDEAMPKGDTKTVSRYTDGTDADSGDDDEVHNDFINVGLGKVVMYVKIGANYYLIAVECPPT